MPLMLSNHQLTLQFPFSWIHNVRSHPTMWADNGHLFFFWNGRYALIEKERKRKNPSTQQPIQLPVCTHGQAQFMVRIAGFLTRGASFHLGVYKLLEQKTSFLHQILWNSWQRTSCLDGYTFEVSCGLSLRHVVEDSPLVIASSLGLFHYSVLAFPSEKGGTTFDGLCWAGWFMLSWLDSLS